MNDGFESLGKSAKGLAKNPLGIIALFIVLVYGFASLVTVCAGSFSPQERLPLIYFLVIFPALVLGVFAWLVSCHSGKLYGPSDFKDEDNYVRMQLNVVSALSAAAAHSSKSETASSHEADIVEPDIDKITDAVRAASSNSKISSNLSKRRILWVDDRPDNNVYERKAFEAIGLAFSLAPSTERALELLDKNQFSAIISDMGRLEGLNEGYVLLESIKKKGIKTPFFIYAGSNLPEHKKEAIKRGAQGSTNNSQELFVSVTKAIINGISK